MVFAAASLRDAVTEAAAGWSGDTRFNFAGSNVLAMQIEATDRAGLFISADEAWMDRLDKGGKLVDGSRRPLLSNQLVLVANAELKLSASSLAVVLEPSARHLSMADPRAVPAGRYAKSWLEAEGIWDQVASKVAPAADVRAAMRIVEADPGVLGIVYGTDARSSGRVRVLLRAANGPEIRYPAALVNRCPSSAAFLEHLEASDAIFSKHGFVPL
jgi:molybdate transport system substrate-binding protein